MTEDLEKKYPSLKLAYEQVKNVLSEQEQAASAIDSKVATLFAISTAIFGIGITLILIFLNIHGLAKVEQMNQAVAIGCITAFLIGCVLLSYWAVIRRAILVYRLRSFVTMDNPEEIRLKMWGLSNLEFYHELLINIELTFYENDEKLKEKVRIFNVLIEWLIIEIVSFLALLLFLVLLKAIGLV